MYKFFFWFFSLIVSLGSCSVESWNQPVSVIPNISQYSDDNIRQIMGYMEISDPDTNYSKMYDILTHSEKSCVWKDFIWYRECFFLNLEEEQQKLISNTKLYDHEKETIYNKTSLLIHSLKKEITFINLYRELDMAPSLWWWESNRWWCSLAWYRIFNQDFFATGSSVVVSYWNSEKELWRIFANSENLTPASLSWILHHENPCEWYTWWPDVWHIFYFTQVWKNQYFFIKTSDGAWSGDFNYTIFHNHGITWGKSYTPIASFPAYAWITPFPRFVRDSNWNEVSILHKNIMQEFINQPFYYITLFEDKRTDYINQIGNILTDITPEIRLN